MRDREISGDRPEVMHCMARNPMQSRVPASCGRSRVLMVIPRSTPHCASSRRTAAIATPPPRRASPANTCRVSAPILVHRQRRVQVLERRRARQRARGRRGAAVPPAYAAANAALPAAHAARDGSTCRRWQWRPARLAFTAASSCRKRSRVCLANERCERQQRLLGVGEPTSRRVQMLVGLATAG